MPFDTIAVVDGQVKIIDQTLLPTQTLYITIETIEDMWEAIKMLRVRGAPAIGVSAAFGVYIGVKHSTAADFTAFQADVEKAADYLATSRPTAVNLFWALDRIKRVASENSGKSVDELKTIVFDEAQRMLEEDAAVCRAIGEFGATLFNEGDGVLTHCNAGGLATARYGTALAPMFIAKENGVTLNVFADETRPLLQGARLTAWELQQADIPVTVICDNMAASVMAKGWIKAVIVGTDRVAANGDVANKIGTYGVAVLAKHHGIPFYVALPTSTIDMNLAEGALIPIEERNSEEITHGFGKQTAPDGIKVYNPAFDVTPNELVTAFVTEKGIIYPPYKENLAQLFQ
ncbi:MAG: S-methyl-5-thioribose-1-phosphate isomerase [Candidatus Hinthialibacter antarcticus]|nr:S-methyl-5-thioribose-1-phosphate isomerase [Candidatus Hinthialibacter antarcticus]